MSTKQKKRKRRKQKLENHKELLNQTLKRRKKRTILVGQERGKETLLSGRALLTRLREERLRILLII